MADQNSTLVERSMRGEKLTFEERREMWISISPGITADGFDEIWAYSHNREDIVPKVGEMAPDFEVDVLDRQRQRTGETMRLSSHRGKQPVGIIFGSYT
jgi:hypothetical protein